MRRLTLDDLRRALPDLDELRPIFDHLLARSEPDPSRTWAGSGELGTVGSRILPEGAASEGAAGVAAEEAARLGELYALVGRAAAGLESGDPAATATALLEAAALEEQRDRPDRAAAYASAAHRAARDGRSERTAALALRRWARATRALGRLDEALDRYVSAHEAGVALSDASAAAEAAIGAGNVLEEQGRWAEADRWYRVALERLDAGDEHTSERWHALLNLHIVTRSAGRVEESVRWLEQAEEVAASTDPAGAAAFLRNARGQLAMARGAFAEAVDQLRAALEVTGHARAGVTIRLNLAEALLAQGRGLEAAEHAREAEREAIQARLVSKLPEVYRLLGRIASTEGISDAFVFFERALQLGRERGLPRLEEALTLQAYAEAEAARGEAEAATELAALAGRLFETLGMEHGRSRWADVYGSGTRAPAPPTDRDDEDHDS